MHRMGEPTMVHVRSGKACSRVAPWTFQRAFAETSNKTIQNHPQIRALNSRDSFWCSVVQFSTHSQGLQLPSGRCQAPDPRRPDQWNVDFFASLWHDSCPVFAHKLLKLLKSEPLDHGMTMGGWFHTLTCSGSHGTYPVATSPYYSRPYSILMDFWTTNQRGAGAASESLSAKRESCTSSKQRHTLPSEREKGYGKSPFLMGKLTISMAIFNSYVKLPEGRPDDEYTTGLPAHVDQMMSLLLGNCASHVECQEL